MKINSQCICIVLQTVNAPKILPSPPTPPPLFCILAGEIDRGV